MSANRRFAGGLLAGLLACVWLVGSSVAGGTDAIGEAIAATELTATARSLAEQGPVVAGGGLLIGLGVGAVIASGATYWYKNRQLERRLR